MELKNAAAVCLITLFSATLVVLIARMLDSQAAVRLEPQLARIADELHALRSAGGVVASNASKEAPPLNDGLAVYYFHGNMRCPTCQAIESQSHEVVQNDFAAQLGRGEIVWKVQNYEDAAGKPLAAKFEVSMPVVVLARMKAGQIESWQRLDKVWALVGDKPTFAAYVRGEIQKMLGAEKPKPGNESTGAPVIPVPNAGDAEMKPPAIPVPQL